ncbi:hypothetical protein [Ktedonospora formicarum]|uniref:Uncharacterized protein n=1 Tax=Ktedonospora formicarum TaxID=2778364 RepID=A0A8J3I0H5_9CHLR|nr:hypothetical protein [Ktedonospora formicarum]GHO43987.1 hypothetical protein KSX_21500 [Ktedonospora formicarum]
MITQTLQRWVRKMFAWWPWRHTDTTNHSQLTTLRNASSTSDTMKTFPSEGPLPQTGMTSVAIEQQSPPSDPPPAQLKSPIKSNTDVSSNALPKKPASTFEQQLAYLRYLYQHGLINEGFSDDTLPKQYRRGRHSDK